MMSGPIAILGATSQLARDFVAEAARAGRMDLRLFARRPEAVEQALRSQGLQARFPVFDLPAFRDQELGAIVNFIGVGDPAAAAAIGSGIFEITRITDELVLDYLRASPATRYVFMSSGAVYGDAFEAPVTTGSRAAIPVNKLGPQNYYGLAKLLAEATHRAQHDLTIVDLRIFNYVSRTLDQNARFLITDMVRAIRTQTIFETTDHALVRDYLDPPGLYGLVCAALNAPHGTNKPADAYTLAPITKAELLDLMKAFGLRYRMVTSAAAINATGTKAFYYSNDRTASTWGYTPHATSADSILMEMASVLGTDAGLPPIGPQ